MKFDNSFKVFRCAVFSVLACTIPLTSQAFLLSGINYAASAGDLEKVKALVKDRPELVFSPSGSGDRPLNYAVNGGHREVAEFLLASHADVNGTNNLGWSPLHSAAATGNKEMVELLLAHGARINARNREGETPLFWAAREGHLDAVQTLLTRKADINAKDNQGNTALNFAAAYERKDVVQLLLKRGATINVFYAVQSGDLKRLKILLKKDPGLASSRDLWGDALLHIAVAGGHTDMVVLLLADKADVNAKNSNNDTPLHMAPTEELTALLLANKADVNARDKSGNSPLHYAVMNKNEGVANVLRQHGGQD